MMSGDGHRDPAHARAGEFDVRPGIPNAMPWSSTRRGTRGASATSCSAGDGVYARSSRRTSITTTSPAPSSSSPRSERGSSRRLAAAMRSTTAAPMTATRSNSAGSSSGRGRRRATRRNTWPGRCTTEAAADGTPSAVLTGGSLLIGSVGRTDLLGADATDALTRQQFTSLRSLAAMPDYVAVWPTHGSGSFCAAGPMQDSPTSTIGAERFTNPLFAYRRRRRHSTNRLVSGFLPYPAYYREMAPMQSRRPPRARRAPDADDALDPAAVGPP